MALDPKNINKNQALISNVLLKIDENIEGHYTTIDNLSASVQNSIKENKNKEIVRDARQISENITSLITDYDQQIQKHQNLYEKKKRRFLIFSLIAVLLISVTSFAIMPSILKYETVCSSLGAKYFVQNGKFHCAFSFDN